MCAQLCLSSCPHYLQFNDVPEPTRLARARPACCGLGGKIASAETDLTLRKRVRVGRRCSKDSRSTPRPCRKLSLHWRNMRSHSETVGQGSLLSERSKNSITSPSMHTREVFTPCSQRRWHILGFSFSLLDGGFLNFHAMSGTACVLHRTRCIKAVQWALSGAFSSEVHARAVSSQFTPEFLHGCQQSSRDFQSRVRSAGPGASVKTPTTNTEFANFWMMEKRKTRPGEVLQDTHTPTGPKSAGPLLAQRVRNWTATASPWTVSC